MHKLIHTHKNYNHKKHSLKINSDKKKDHPIWVKIVIAVLSISVFILFLGVTGIVENKSPENLASLGTLSTSFVTYFEYHALIITGALGLTLAVWFMEHH